MRTVSGLTAGTKPVRSLKQGLQRSHPPGWGQRLGARAALLPQSPCLPRSPAWCRRGSAGGRDRAARRSVGPLPQLDGRQGAAAVEPSRRGARMLSRASYACISRPLLPPTHARTPSRFSTPVPFYPPTKICLLFPPTHSNNIFLLPTHLHRAPPSIRAAASSPALSPRPAPSGCPGREDGHAVHQGGRAGADGAAGHAAHVVRGRSGSRAPAAKRVRAGEVACMLACMLACKHGPGGPRVESKQYLSSL